MPLDLTSQATQGFLSVPNSACPYYTSSPAGMAWHVGAWLKRNGHAAPRDVRPSRGYKMRANGVLFDASHAPDIKQIG